MTHPHAPKTAQRHRFHLLDALRGLAAGVVILVHAPAYLNTSGFAPNAFLAVDFFFCLSGFVIAFSYRESLETGRLSFGMFLRARLTRLYPVYLLGTALGLATLISFDPHLPAVATKPRLLATVTLGLLILPNIFPALSEVMFPLNLPAWSLSFELLVNLLAGLLWVRKVNSIRAAVILAILGFSALVWWTAGDHLLGEIGWKSNPDLLLLDCARVVTSFSGGLLVHALYRNRKLGNLTSFGSCMVIAAGLLLLLLSPLKTMQTSRFQLFCIAIIFPGLVLTGAHVRIPEVFESVCALLGEISYPMYLLHIILLRPLGFRAVQLFASAHPKEAKALLPGTIFLTIWVSYIVAKWYDAPLRGFIFRTLLKKR